MAVIPACVSCYDAVVHSRHDYSKVLLKASLVLAVWLTEQAPEHGQQPWLYDLSEVQDINCIWVSSTEAQNHRPQLRMRFAALVPQRAQD